MRAMDQDERQEFIRDLRTRNAASSRALHNDIVQRVLASPMEDKMDQWRRDGEAVATARAAEKEHRAKQELAIAERQRSIVQMDNDVGLLLEVVEDLLNRIAVLERRAAAAPDITATSTADIPDFLPRRRGPDGTRYTQPLVTRRHGRR
jgi:hypothetical protein